MAGFYVFKLRQRLRSTREHLLVKNSLDLTKNTALLRMIGNQIEEDCATTDDPQSMMDIEIREKRNLVRVSDRLYRLICIIYMALQPWFRDEKLKADTPQQATDYLSRDSHLHHLFLELFPEEEQDYLKGMLTLECEQAILQILV